MKKYIGKKEVQATFAIRKGGKIYLPTDSIPRTMEKVEDGYKVVYEDGYQSWLPKEVFEKAYKPADTFKDRLMIEQQELKERLDKLCSFVDSPKFEEVVTNNEQRELLYEQCQRMSDYLQVLNKRIANL